MSTGYQTERRKTTRLPVLIDVVVVDVAEDANRTEAELLDVSEGGAGLVFAASDGWLQNEMPIKVEFESPFLTNGVLLGKLRTTDTSNGYRPNTRNAGFCVDSKFQDQIQQLISSCDAGPPAPAGVSLGFHRAWNILDETERVTLSDYWANLQAGGIDATTVARNLMTDPNCSATRLLSVMRIILLRLFNSSKPDAFTVLEEAFEIYRRRQCLNDTPKDRLINYELGLPRLSGL